MFCFSRPSITSVYVLGKDSRKTHRAYPLRPGQGHGLRLSLRIESMGPSVAASRVSHQSDGWQDASKEIA